MKLLVFDNYDSFTYNLVHMVQHILKQKVDVYRNDELTLDEVNRYDKIILSPGPGIPSEAGLLLPLINTFAPVKSILGVCLGHQAIGESFGGNLYNLESVYHGVATPVILDKTNRSSIFIGLEERFEAGRYHSWIIEDKNFPSSLSVTARDENGYIMALKHKTFDVQGVQFHPESVLTPQGELMLKNWLFETGNENVNHEKDN